MKLWKKITLGLASILLLGGLGIYQYMQGFGDVRTDYTKAKGSSAIAQKKGRTLLDQSIAKLGGIARWKTLRNTSTQIRFQHFWHHPLLKTFFMPIEYSGQKMSLLLKPGSTNTRLTFLDGKWKGKAWGIRDGKAYQVDARGALTSKQDKTILFHVPSYRFFFFMPFYLAEAELITYAGTQKRHGKTYDLIYATWGKWTPQKKVDQYLMWINRKTLLIDFVQSSVRAMFARSIVTLSLSNYKDVLGVKLPFSLKVLQDIQVIDEGMHHVKVLKIERNAARQDK